MQLCAPINASFMLVMNRKVERSSVKMEYICSTRRTHMQYQDAGSFVYSNSRFWPRYVSEIAAVEGDGGQITFPRVVVNVKPLNAITRSSPMIGASLSCLSSRWCARTVSPRFPRLPCQRKERQKVNDLRTGLSTCDVYGQLTRGALGSVGGFGTELSGL